MTELDIAMNVAEATANSAELLQEGGGTVNESPMLEQGAAAAIGIGLAALGAGYAERGIGSAAVGALAEDSISTGIGIVLTVLPETLVIFALVALFV